MLRKALKISEQKLMEGWSCLNFRLDDCRDATQPSLALILIQTHVRIANETFLIDRS